jgi:hypothetical protein
MKVLIGQLLNSWELLALAALIIVILVRIGGGY